LEEALEATRESRRIEFKREFSAATPGSWCELLKDVAAMANSGGGAIIIGLENDGTPSGWDPSAFLRTDLADLTNTFAKYVSEQLDDFEIRAAERGRRPVAAVIIQPRLGSPIVFEKPGTYADAPGSQKTAFSRGTAYFRHGAKSEPGSTRDLARFIAREVERQRRAWLSNIRKVAAAPKNARVLVLPTKTTGSAPVAGVRVVDDPDAPVVGRTDFDTTHPHRQKDVVRLANAKIGSSVINQFDILCLRKVHNIDSQPVFFHKPRFSSPQYSDAFVDWLVDEHGADSNFFEQTKATYRNARRKSAVS
jgi:hypothetical protein